MGNATHLTLGWGISQARDTAGYNIRRLRDDSTGKRYRCNGGGYDMTGTVFADWLCDAYQDRLRAIADQAHMTYGAEPVDDGPLPRTVNDNGLYGMYAYVDGSVRVDGACGMSSVVRIAEAAGLSVQRVYGRTGGGEVAIVVTEA